ncbi:MAG: hypothetical protein EP344_09325 [Bacteroidetes bacterium]|nr:MAG: hypothetical protein EP344_09325 [Bacteroidota bacterium]
MKTKLLLLVLSATLLTTACERDPYPLEMERFDVYWYDNDNSGTNTPADDLDFEIRVNTTDPDKEDQFITDWEFSYSVNGTFVGILQSDTDIRTNGLGFTGSVSISNLPLPFPGGLLPGDQFEFRFWATDNHGTQIEQYYTFELE